MLHNVVHAFRPVLAFGSKILKLMSGIVVSVTGASQEIPTVENDWWRPVTSRGFLPSICEAFISQCWTCVGY